MAQASDQSSPAQVFAGLQVYVDPAVGGRFRETLPALLSAHGAIPPPPLPSPPASPRQPSSTARSASAESRKLHRFALPQEGSDQVVVVVADGLGFPEYEQEFRGRKAEGRWVVTPAWVLQCVKSELRHDPMFFSPDPRLFFSGVCVCCSDQLSEGDRQAINAGVLAYGGQVKAFLTKEVTHLITPSASGDMYALVQEYPEAQIAPVLPHWIDACLSLSHLVPSRPYEFPDPVVLRHPADGYAGGAIAAALASAEDDVTDARRLAVAQMTGKADFGPATADANGDESGGTGVWAGKKIRFCADLEVELGRRQSWAARVQREGGAVVGVVEEADVLVGRYRDGTEYNVAVKLGITIGSLAWFYHVCSTGAVTSPLRRLLHYPVPRGKIPEFASVLVTLTNYTGETRDYVRTLVELMGGTFTPDFSRANTHVIASVKHGNKIARAIQWEKPIVSHLWVEACFTQWRLVAITAQPQFTSFADGTNLVTLVGTRGWDEAELRPWAERAKAAADGEGEGIKKAGPKPRYEAAVLPAPALPIPRPGQQPSVAASGPSIIAASYDTTAADAVLTQARSPARPLPAGARPSPVPSPLRTSTTTRAGPLPSATEVSSSTANLAPPPTSSSKVVSSDDPLALRSPSQRRPVQPTPPRAAPSSPEKENSPPAKKLALASPIRQSDVDAPPSSRTDRSATSSPVRPPPTALKPTTAAQADGERPAAPGPSKPVVVSATPASKSTATHPRPSSSTPRGLDDGAILPTNSRRKAADAATKRLHDEIMPDLLDYEKAKRNKTLMSGGRAGRSDSAGPSERSSSPDKVRSTNGKGKGRASTEAEDESDDALQDDGEDEIKVDLQHPAPARKIKRKLVDEEEEDSETAARPAKPAKRGPGRPKKEVETNDIPSISAKGSKRAKSAAASDSGGPDPASVAILTTQVTLTGPQQKWIKSTGAKIVTKPLQCTYLVAGGISRTEKFLCALAIAPVVVDKTWIPACVKAGHFVDPAPHLLKDPESEKRYGIELQELLSKAGRYKTGAAGQVGLLKGMTFYATRQVETDYDVLRRIVESHKGKLSNAIPRYKTFSEDPTHHILISCPPDKELWKPLKDQGVSVYTRELILGGLIRQEMDFTKDKL